MVAPVPWFPSANTKFGRYGVYGKIPRHEVMDDLQIEHPKYFIIPKIGMTVTPFFLAASAIPPVRNILASGHNLQ